VLTTPAFIVAAVLVSQLPATSDRSRSKDAPLQQLGARPDTDRSNRERAEGAVDLTNCRHVIVKTGSATRACTNIQPDAHQRHAVTRCCSSRLKSVAGGDAVDYELTVPAWINLNIDGNEATWRSRASRATSSRRPRVTLAAWRNVEAESVDGKITVDFADAARSSEHGRRRHRDLEGVRRDRRRVD
jgi:hypothetical protein